MSIGKTRGGTFHAAGPLVKPPAPGKAKTEGTQADAWTDRPGDITGDRTQHWRRFEPVEGKKVSGFSLLLASKGGTRSQAAAAGAPPKPPGPDTAAAGGGAPPGGPPPHESGDDSAPGQAR